MIFTSGNSTPAIQKLTEVIKDLAKKNTRLTWAIIVLTAAMIILTIVEIALLLK